MNSIVTIAIGPAKNFFAVHGVVSKGILALLCASVPRAKLREIIAAPSTLSLPWKRALVNGSFAVGLPRSAQGPLRPLTEDTCCGCLWCRADCSPSPECASAKPPHIEAIF